MRTLITGGAGFIGSHVAGHLLDKGEQVVILDDFSAGSDENLKSMGRKPEIIRGSVLNSGAVRKAMRNCDAVLHLAAAVGVKRILEDPLESFRINVEGTQTVLEEASKLGLRSIIASSSEIYGKSDAIPLSEEDDRVLGNTHITRWSYANAKAGDEYLARFYAARGLPVTIARFFNTVGPRQSAFYGMVIPRFVKQALAGEALTVYHDGSQIRCFCAVQDVSEALVLLRDSKKTVGEAYNIGTDEQTTILSLAKKVINISGSSSRIVFVPYEKVYGAQFEDIARRVPSISKIRKEVGWVPKTRLDAILRAIIASSSAHRA